MNCTKYQPESFGLRAHGIAIFLELLGGNGAYQPEPFGFAASKG